MKTKMNSKKQMLPEVIRNTFVIALCVSSPSIADGNRVGNGGFADQQAQRILDSATWQLKYGLPRLTPTLNALPIPVSAEKLVKIVTQAKRLPLVNRSRRDANGVNRPLAFNYGTQNGQGYIEVLAPFFERQFLDKDEDGAVAETKRDLIHEALHLFGYGEWDAAIYGDEIAWTSEISGGLHSIISGDERWIYGQHNFLDVIDQINNGPKLYRKQMIVSSGKRNEWSLKEVLISRSTFATQDPIGYEGAVLSFDGDLSGVLEQDLNRSVPVWEDRSTGKTWFISRRSVSKNRIERDDCESLLGMKSHWKNLRVPLAQDWKTALENGLASLSLSPYKPVTEGPGDYTQGCPIGADSNRGYWARDNSGSIVIIGQSTEPGTLGFQAGCIEDEVHFAFLACVSDGEIDPGVEGLAFDSGNLIYRRLSGVSWFLY